MSTLLQPGRNLNLLSCCRVSREAIVSQQNRYSHQNAHRTIAVKLLQDIPGVGEKYSIQSIAPGRMRHVFYPRKQAAYITERTKKDSSASSLQSQLDLSNIRNRLLSLEPLVFQRAVHISDAAANTEPRRLKGPVTAYNIVQRLAQHQGINLAPLNATIAFQNSPSKDRVGTTGQYHVLIYLSTGDIFPIKVFIEPKTATLESRLTPREAVGTIDLMNDTKMGL